MASANDILDDPANGDLSLVDGDVHWGDATEQLQKDLLLARPGDYKAAPAVGVGLEDYLLDETTTDLARAIRVQFSGDGMTVRSISLNLSSGKIQIDASY